MADALLSRQTGPSHRHRGQLVCRWLARLTSLGTMAVIGAFAFGEGTPTSKEWLLLAFFPIGLLLGLLIGWWRELLGGTIGVVSVSIAYSILWTKAGHSPGPYFALLALPAALFVASGLLAKSAQ